ncbi:hypothetical protein FRB95_008113 [Tulasnella sp. JGI-2019a]|nr:hypothetical protein FRB95_008113 [Tulasnella sp. JGI-2019a]
MLPADAEVVDDFIDSFTQSMVVQATSVGHGEVAKKLPQLLLLVGPVMYTALLGLEELKQMELQADLAHMVNLMLGSGTETIIHAKHKLQSAWSAMLTSRADGILAGRDFQDTHLVVIDDCSDLLPSLQIITSESPQDQPVLPPVDQPGALAVPIPTAMLSNSPTTPFELHTILTTISHNLQPPAIQITSEDKTSPLTLHSHNQETLVIGSGCFESEGLTGYDVNILRDPGAEINSDIMNTFRMLIMDEVPNKSVYVASTFLWLKIIGPAPLWLHIHAKWFKDRSLHDYDHLLFPIHTTNPGHWAVLYVDISAHAMHYYDSIRSGVVKHSNAAFNVHFQIAAPLTKMTEISPLGLEVIPQ